MTGEVIEFTVPLPPVILRANGRGHYMAKGRAADEYSHMVGVMTYDSPIWRKPAFGTFPWPAAHVTYTWCYSGVRPDHGNLGGNTKYLQDILCMAPKSKAGKNRWYLGLIEDDKGIEATYLLERVSHKADEAVVIRVERIQ